MSKVRITNKLIINSVVGVIYQMHPYHNPEGINKIVQKINKWCDETPDCIGSIKDTFKIFEWNTWEDFEKWLNDFLNDILEFRQLNISRKLKDEGIKDIDDERNSGIRFVDRYTVDTQDERYTDFIDLDACVRNIVRQIGLIQQMDEDCFLCKYAKEYGSMEPSECEQCKNCLCNPKIRYNRETHPMALKPKKDWTEEEKEKYKL